MLSLVIAGTMEDSEALGFRFAPLGGNRCASSVERRPRAFVRLGLLCGAGVRSRPGLSKAPRAVGSALVQTSGCSSFESRRHSGIASTTKQFRSGVLCGGGDYPSENGGSLRLQSPSHGADATTKSITR